MKKIIMVFMLLICLTGCGKMDSATKEVKNYLNNYRNLDSAVLDDLEKEVDNQNLTESQKKTYRDILKKQYKDMSYEIEKEEKSGDMIYVTAKVSVYDLYKTQSDASLYLADHMKEFYDSSGKYDTSKYMDYKLEQMKETTNKVKYTIVFTVTKVEDKLTVMQPSKIDLEKIHGIYSYDIK